MILKVNRQSDDFYKIMGRYFADRSFIKEMDCQLYDNGALWYLAYDGNTLCGFVSAEYKGKYVWIDNFYVFDEYRHQGYGTALIRRVLIDNPVCKCITRNEYAKRIFEKYGFVETGKNGRYSKLAYDTKSNDIA